MSVVSIHWSLEYSNQLHLYATRTHTESILGCMQAFIISRSATCDLGLKVIILNVSSHFDSLLDLLSWMESDLQKQMTFRSFFEEKKGESA